MNMLPVMDNALQVDIVKHGLNWSLFGSNMIFEQKVASTNTLAKELAASGAPSGTLVVAEEQSAGKGRLGRKWLSPPGANLLFSVMLRPHVRTDEVFQLTMAMALAAIAGISETCGIHPMIKWPNDLYAHDKKLGGMLSEFCARDKFVEYVIIGLGLNVNWNPETRQLAGYTATSLRAETGLKISREDLLVGILKIFDSYYNDVLAGNLEDYYEKWNRSSMLNGRRVKLRTPTQRMYGKVIRIDRNGALIILDNKGRERIILSAEISLDGIDDEALGNGTTP